MLLIALLVIAIEPRDAEFERIQIEWIAETGKVRDFSQVVGSEEAGLIRLLGSADYQVRELARAELQRRGDRVHVALCWGTRAKDMETATRCRSIRGEMFRCVKCKGVGVVDVKGAAFESNAEGDLETGGPLNETDCHVCGGSGDTRLEAYWYYVYGPFGGQMLQAVRPRELFKGAGR